MVNSDSEYNRLEWLCRYLLDENPRYRQMPVPDSRQERRDLFRALMNVRPPEPVSEEFLQVQDEELQALLAEKGVVEILRIAQNGIVEWQGDITRLKVDAIVNAANSQMLGCFVPLHRCIDNAIHSAAGVQLRLACEEMMKGSDEPTGSARITPGFNLPAKYVIHTIGPIVTTPLPLRQQEAQLSSCYTSCLDLANKYGLASIAFCCISTGEFRFPNDRACFIAVSTVRSWMASHLESSVKTVIFNTFKDIDHELYKNALAKG
ncbi:MAG: protein-ADP-ribose hydrolase [Bacteroidales bacterium]|nr:protein-ADP-ribose hydrolase [Bacteroidales bacterium]